MILNPNVNVDTEKNKYCDIFTPDDGYALWDDTETDNLDENGEPMLYWLTMMIQKSHSEERAPHIWAKLIDYTMEVYGKPDKPEIMRATLSNENDNNVSNTYIDENGVERPKKGVY